MRQAAARAGAAAPSRSALAVALAGGLVVATLALALRAALAEPAAPWSLEVSEQLALVPGGVGSVKVALRGRGRFVVSRSGLLLDLLASGHGLSLRQRRYQYADAVEAEADAPSFSIPVRAEAAGAYSLEVRARFWVCTPRTCLPVDERRVVAVEVREPLPPDAGGALDAARAVPSTAPDAAPRDARPRPRRRSP